jgi:hypothetical protein
MFIKRGDAQPITSVLKEKDEIKRAEKLAATIRELAKKAQDVQEEEAKKKETN